MENSNKSKTRKTKPKIKTNRLKLLVTVVNKKKAEYYLDLIQSFDVNMQFLSLARGTADKDIMQIVGIIDLEKAVIFSLIQEDKEKAILGELEMKFASIKNGKGIAYTLSLSSVVGKTVFAFLTNDKSAIKGDNHE